MCCDEALVPFMTKVYMHRASPRDKFFYLGDDGAAADLLDLMLNWPGMGRWSPEYHYGFPKAFRRDARQLALCQMRARLFPRDVFVSVIRALASLYWHDEQAWIEDAKEVVSNK